jgi:hypothetical protein
MVGGSVNNLSTKSDHAQDVGGAVLVELPFELVDPPAPLEPELPPVVMARAPSDSAGSIPVRALR